MSEIKSRLVVVGSHAPGISVRVTRIPVAGETVIGWGLAEPLDGGKGTNQAIASTRLGLPTSFVGCVGIDKLGDDCEYLLRAEGVDVSYLFRSKSKKTGAGIIILDENGIPAMVTTIGANGELNHQHIHTALEGLKGAEILMTQFEISTGVALHAARVARQFKMTTIINPAPVSPVNISDLEVADFLVPNEVEAKVLLGIEPETQIYLEFVAQRLLKRSNAGKVIITAGDQGIIGADPSGVWRWQPPKVNVIDTSGAGDVFCAALAVGLAKGM